MEIIRAAQIHGEGMDAVNTPQATFGLAINPSCWRRDLENSKKAFRLLRARVICIYIYIYMYVYVGWILVKRLSRRVGDPSLGEIYTPHNFSIITSGCYGVGYYSKLACIDCTEG